jgi:hypothetical protein
MIGALAGWLHEPHNRVRSAVVLLAVTLIGWPVTHVLLALSSPPGASGWVFHLLLALSWASLTLTALNILATTEMRKKVET